MPRQALIRPSRENVFADLHLPDADDLPIQAELTRLIYLRVKELGLTQVETAARLGLKQPDVSKLMNGRHSGFSAERLFRFLNALGQDIQIVIRQKPPRARRNATVSVVTG